MLAEVIDRLNAARERTARKRPPAIACSETHPLHRNAQSRRVVCESGAPAGVFIKPAVCVNLRWGRVMRGAQVLATAFSTSAMPCSRTVVAIALHSGLHANDALRRLEREASDTEHPDSSVSHFVLVRRGSLLSGCAVAQLAPQDLAHVGLRQFAAELDVAGLLVAGEFVAAERLDRLRRQ